MLKQKVRMWFQMILKVFLDDLQLFLAHHAVVTVRYLFFYDPTNYETSPFSVLLRVASHPPLEEKNRIRIYTMNKIVFLISVLSLSYCASLPADEVKLKWGNMQYKQMRIFAFFVCFDFQLNLRYPETTQFGLKVGVQLWNHLICFFLHVFYPKTSFFFILKLCIIFIGSTSD